jgi:maleate isomerase
MHDVRMMTGAVTPEVVDGAQTVADTGVGIVVPYDFALDRELWRWTPPGVNLLLTRTPYAAMPVTLAQAKVVSDSAAVAEATRAVLEPGPGVVAYACTSGSFVRGPEGEQELVEAMVLAGAPAAVTTSGALLEALAHLGAGSVAVATPYDEAITLRLEEFLAAAGVQVTGGAFLGLSGQIWTVPYLETADLVRQAAASGGDAVFVSCTNLLCYDLIAPLEEELGVPVITANQVTMWAALRRVGMLARGHGQSLLTGRESLPTATATTTATATATTTATTATVSATTTDPTTTLEVADVPVAT